MGLFRKRTKKKVEFEPAGVKESLIEMKDLSEQIIDLSYAAIIFDSDDIAREVDDLEERLDRLLYSVRIGLLLAARNREDAEKLSGILQVAAAAEQIGDVSADLIKLLDEDIEFRPFAPFFLKDADEKIWAVKVARGSHMVGNTVGKMSVESETGARIIAIKRGNRWIYDIDSEHRLKQDDTLIVRGVEDGLKELSAYAKGDARWGEYRR